MTDKDLAIDTALWVGGLTTIHKLAKNESAVPAMLGAFFLGLFIMVGAKLSPAGARAFCVVVATTAFLINGSEVLNLVVKLSGGEPDKKLPRFTSDPAE